MIGYYTTVIPSGASNPVRQSAIGSLGLFVFMMPAFAILILSISSPALVTRSCAFNNKPPEDIRGFLFSYYALEKHKNYGYYVRKVIKYQNREN